MKRSARGAASLQYAAAGCVRSGVRAPPHGTAGCWLIVLILFVSALCSGCDATQPVRLLLEDDDDVEEENVTLTADNVCSKNIVQEKRIFYYNLDVSDCFEDPSLSYSYLSVEARIYQRCADSHEWSVLVNTEGERVSIDEARRDPENETFVDFIDAEHHQFYGHLDDPLDRNGSQPWVVGLYSNCGPVQYTLKAWCTASKGCNLSCSDPDSGPCVSLENCRCIKEDDQEGCDIDVEDLPDEEDLVTRYGLTISHTGDTLRYGAWKYFRFKAVNNASRILVELERAYGDVILFVKPGDSNEHEPLSSSLPMEADALKYADLPSFQNRLSHHHVFTNGSGNFYIGVYNTDNCVEEDTTFNLTITIATPSDPLNLCPLNCSFPQGQCVRDNVCSCEPGFGGRYCGGSLWPAAPRKTYSGQLLPGGWAYINMTIDQLTDHGDVSIQFSSSTGHSILLTQRNRFPTLKDFDLKFSNSTLGSTPSDTYHINRASLSSGGLILGIFNVDYSHRGVSDFEIVILGARKGRLSIWMILLVALGSSVFLLAIIATVRHVMQRRGEVVAESWGLDFEATPQDLEMVQKRVQDRVMMSTLPLLAYQQGLLPKEDAGCSICLNSYSIAEIVCRLPVCKHVFHMKCLEEWFQTDKSCPLCRLPLQEHGRVSSSESPLSPDSQPPLSGPSNLGKALDQQAPPCSSRQGGGHDDNPAPSTAKENRQRRVS